MSLANCVAVASCAAVGSAGVFGWGLAANGGQIRNLPGALRHPPRATASRSFPIRYS